jgi:nicotinate-nucleotide pyrophosphorylase (carboxylating)
MTTPLFTQKYPRGSVAFNTLVQSNVSVALQEDIGTGDLTAALVPDSLQTTANIISRENAVICGVDWAEACFKQLDNNIQIKWLVNEGEKISTNQVLCTIKGNTRAILTAERCALNFLQTLSAVATQTREFVKAISCTKANVLDTRKTLPGLRLAQKYAVTVGGGKNQRLALYDGMLIKENHIAAAGSIHAALEHALKLNSTLSQPVSIQIEVENLNQLQQALDAGANSILLDNFSISEMRDAVQLNNDRAVLEASGNVDLNSVRDIVHTGVHNVSIGGLTKNIRAVDLSLRIIN